MNYRTMKIVNLVLGILCLSIESYVYRNSYYLTRIDQIYIGVVAFFLFETLITLLFYATPSSRDSFWRTISCVVLFGIGGLLIYSGVYIEKSEECFEYIKDCQEYEYKLTAGILAMINGVIYLLAKAEDKDSETILPSTSSAAAANVGDHRSGNHIFTTNPINQMPAPPPPYPFGQQPQDFQSPPSYQSLNIDQMTNSQFQQLPSTIPAPPYPGLGPNTTSTNRNKTNLNSMSSADMQY